MKTSLTVLVIAVAVALAWALGRDPGEQGSLAPPSPMAFEAEEAHPEANLLEVVPETEAAAQRTEIPQGFPEALTEEPSHTPLDPNTAGKLEVLAVARETGAPLPGVSIHANADDGSPVEWVERDGKDGAPITDEAGRARFLVSPGAYIRLWTSTSPGGATASRDLGTLESGESRTVQLEFPTQPDAVLVGRVVQATGGTPISDARIRLLALAESSLADDARGSGSDPSIRIRTGPDGYFETPVATWSRRYGRVDS